MWALPQGKSPFHPTTPHCQLQGIWHRCSSPMPLRLPGWPLPAAGAEDCSPSHPELSSALLGYFSSLVKHRWLFPCSKEGTMYVRELPAEHESQRIFCCERVGGMSNISRFPWLLYLHESHPQEGGSLAGGHWERVFAGSCCRLGLPWLSPPDISHTPLSYSAETFLHSRAEPAPLPLTQLQLQPSQTSPNFAPCHSRLPPTACSGSAPPHRRKHAESYNAHGPFFKNLNAVKSSVNPVYAAVCAPGGEAARREFL